jgi:hypothetical protein
MPPSIQLVGVGDNDQLSMCHRKWVEDAIRHWVKPNAVNLRDIVVFSSAYSPKNSKPPSHSTWIRRLPAGTGN